MSEPTSLEALLLALTAQRENYEALSAAVLGDGASTSDWKDPVAVVLALRRENDVLRGIATKIMPCHYCGADSIGKCPHGFPGCALADDLWCCEESTNEECRKLRAEIAALKGQP